MEHLLIQSDDLKVEVPSGSDVQENRKVSINSSEPKPKKGKLETEVNSNSEVFNTDKKGTPKRKVVKSVIGKILKNGTEVLQTEVGPFLRTLCELGEGFFRTLFDKF